MTSVDNLTGFLNSLPRERLNLGDEDMETLSILLSALSADFGRLDEKLTMATNRFRELANSPELPEHWRNACNLWSIIINNDTGTL